MLVHVRLAKMRSKNHYYVESDLALLDSPWRAAPILSRAGSGSRPQTESGAMEFQDSVTHKDGGFLRARCTSGNMNWL